MITVDIDMFTPCLKDLLTGELVETEVLRVSRKSFLNKYNKKNGWYTNWAKLADEYEIFALVIKGTVDIQGLVAVGADDESGALYVAWIVAAPHNNREIVESPKYGGVGGHLFAVAIQRSIYYNFGGAIFGIANSRQRLEQYIEYFGADHIGFLHEFHFMIADNAAIKILEKYNYEWSDDEL